MQIKHMPVMWETCSLFHEEKLHREWFLKINSRSQETLKKAIFSCSPKRARVNFFVNKPISDLWSNTFCFKKSFYTLAKSIAPSICFIWLSMLGGVKSISRKRHIVCTQLTLYFEQLCLVQCRTTLIKSIWHLAKSNFKPKASRLDRPGAT